MSTESISTILSTVNNTEHRGALADLFEKVLGILPSSHAGTVNLGGVNGADIASIKFNLNPTIAAHEEGQLHWDANAQTLSLGMIGGEVELQIGQENLIRVYNATGADIPNGAAVYIVDAGDQKPRIALAKADAEPTAYVMGLTTETIEDETQGWIVTTGLMRDFDTSDWTEGYPLYLSADDAGLLVETAPEVPNFSTIVGYTIRSHNNFGSVLVAPRPVRIPTVIKLIEVSTPDAIANIGQVYTKTDNKLYFQDGAGVEHEIALVP